MTLTKKQKKIIDIIQWILIIGLIGAIALFYAKKDQWEEHKKELQREDTYVQIYDSQELATLKKRNKELYDSVMHYKNAEIAMQVQYVYKYKTDTVTVEKFIQQPDSIYHYVADNDTIKSEITIKATDLQWAATSVEIHDNFKIINVENNGQNQLVIDHSPNVEIENVDVWHRQEKNKWYQNFTFGPQVGVGYGLTKRQFDVYIGVGIGYKF